jgi:hypothetical protein
MDRDICTVLAGYIIETVCKYDAYCSSPAGVGCIVDDMGDEVAQKTKTPARPEISGMGLVIVASSRHALIKQGKLLDNFYLKHPNLRQKSPNSSINGSAVFRCF